MNEANIGLWIAIREEKGYWGKNFNAVAINSHEVDAACKKGTEFAHEEDSGVEEAAGNTAADCKLVCSRQMARGKWAKAYRVQESKAKRYNSKRPKEVEEKCKWRLYHSDGMISGSMNKRIKEIHSGAPSPADVLQKENACKVNMQTGRKQQGTLGTNYRHQDTRNSSGSMDEQTRKQNYPMPLLHVVERWVRNKNKTVLSHNNFSIRVFVAFYRSGLSLQKSENSKKHYLCFQMWFCRKKGPCPEHTTRKSEFGTKNSFL